MFTGIIQELGHVAAFESQTSGGARLRIGAKLAERLKPGDSVAVNGCCLTVTEIRAESEPPAFVADLAPETLRRTSLSRLTPGAAVNLEPPLRAGDLLSGHMVQGHVEGVGRLLALERQGDGGAWLQLRLPAELLPYVVWKGSLTVEGISLTIASLESDVAGFAIIPFTWEHTNLHMLSAGAAVNLETDPVARHIERLLEARGTVDGGAPAVGARPERDWSVGELREQGF